MPCLAVPCAAGFMVIVGFPFTEVAGLEYFQVMCLHDTRDLVLLLDWGRLGRAFKAMDARFDPRWRLFIDFIRLFLLHAFLRCRAWGAPSTWAPVRP